MNQKLNMLRLLLAAFVIIAAIGGLSSCEKFSFIPEKINPEIPIHFQAEIQPIFTSNCITCHSGIRPPDLRDGHSYKALTEGDYVNKPGESSKLYLKMTSTEHTPRSTDKDKQNVLIWINQGALNN
jgi:hypothetical protein